MRYNTAWSRIVNIGCLLVFLWAAGIVSWAWFFSGDSGVPWYKWFTFLAVPVLGIVVTLDNLVLEYLIQKLSVSLVIVSNPPPKE